MRLLYKAVSNTSANASFNSNVVAVGEYDSFSVTCNVNSTAVGTVKLQVSNDWSQDEYGSNVAKWTDLSGASSSVSIGNDVVFNIKKPGYPFMRVVYTLASGTGTATIDFNGKAPTERGRPYYSGG
jgi:hypothetical protein